MSFSTIILAAGQGVRMKSTLPKVMHKIASRPMIDWILATLKKLASKDCVVVIGPEMKILEEHVRQQDSNIKFSVQKKRLGTGDAVKIGLGHLKNQTKNVLILYGDVPFIKAATIKKMESKLAKDPKAALVVLGFEAQDPAHYGRLVINQAGYLQKIVEFLDCTDAEKKISICNSGIMMVNGKNIGQLLSKIKANKIKKEFYLTDVVDIALTQGLDCHHIITKEAEVVAVNNRKDLAKAEATIQDQLRNHFLLNGVTLIDPNSVYFSGDTVIGQDVVIHPNVFIGPGVKIGSDVQIKSFSHIEGAIIKNNATVGPFARIRPGTELGMGVRIGNFVEIKNSKVASGSKINHLTYIGDTKMGSNVNIGAGTITCNYDGFNKHKTTIGDNVFVGSNVALVAPISIGKDALLAAGSVITKDVRAGDLAIERTTQQNIKSGAANIAEKKRR